MTYSNGKEIAWVNCCLIAANIISFLYLEVRGSTEDADFMIRNGAMYAPYILENKEYYRLITSIFMHFGIEHIANNMLILFVLGGNMERALGKVKYILFYLTCGIGANIISMMFEQQEYGMIVSAGASGAIFGVIGGLLYAVVINRGQLEDLDTKQLVMVVICSLYFGFSSSGVDNVAHVAGLAIGIIMSFLLYRNPGAQQKMNESL